MTQDSHEPAAGPQIPSQETISGIYAETIAHNSEYSHFGKFMAVMVGSMVSAEIPTVDEENAGVESNLGEIADADAQAHVAEADLAGDMVSFTADDQLASIGLVLEPTGTYVTGKHDHEEEGERVTTQALEPHLVSPVKFASFLRTLSPEAIAQDKPIRTLAADVVAGLASRTRTAFDPSSERAEDVSEEESATIGAEQLKSFSAIMDDYERLGLSGSREFEQMTAYVDRWAQDVLPEYMVAEKNAYLQPDIQGFGPASWQKDPAGLGDRWEDAISFAHGLMQDPRTMKFGQEVNDALTEALDKAIAWSDDPVNSVGRPFMDGVRATLADASRSLGNDATEQDVFQGLAESLGTPSIESQQNTLEQLSRRYYAELQDSGVLAKVVDQMHMDAGERTVSLERVLSRGVDGGPDTEEHFFRVNYADVVTKDGVTTSKFSNSHIAVSRSVGGIVEPIPPFDEQDAGLIGHQVAELLEMKETGVLPNLAGNLSSIIDPSTMMSLKPPTEQD